MDSTTDLTYWPLLRRVKIDFLPRIKQFYIFASGESALLFSHDDRTYAFGSNVDLTLPIGKKSEATEPVEIDELRGCHPKSVMEALMADFVLLLTVDHDLYGWGHNVSGLVGNGDRNPVLQPLKVMSSVAKCIWRRTSIYALNTSGAIWKWGEITKGKFVYKPQRFKPLAKFTAKDISGYMIGDVSIATKDNRIVLWKEDSGFENMVTRSPVLPKFKCFVTPFRSHCYYIDTDGKLVAFGESSGSWNFQNRSDISVPIESAYCYWAQMYALARDHTIVCFDIQIGTHAVNPSFKSIPDLHHFYFPFESTPLPTTLPREVVDPARLAALNSFNDPTNSDLILKIFVSNGLFFFNGEPNSNKKRIFLHKAVVFDRSPAFRTFLSQFRMYGKTIYLDERTGKYRFPIYFCFLRHLYTGEVDIKPELFYEIYKMASDMKDKELLQKLDKWKPQLTLDDWIRSYWCFSFDNYDMSTCDFKGIGEKVEEEVWSRVTVDNCCYVYSKIQWFHYDEQGLKERLVSFIKPRFPQVSKTESYRALSDELRRALVTRLTQDATGGDSSHNRNRRNRQDINVDQLNQALQELAVQMHSMFRK